MARSCPGLTHSFSTSVEGLEAEVVDVGDGRPEDLERARRQDRAGPRAGLAGAGLGGSAGRGAGPRPRPHGPSAQHDRDDGLGDAGTGDGVADPGHAVPVDPRRRRREAARPPGRGPPAAAHDDARAHGLDAHPPSGRRADRAPRGPLPPALRPRRLLALRRHGQRLGQRDHAGGRPAAGGAARGAATRHPLRVLVGALARPLRGLGLVRRPRLARAAPALRRPPQRRLDGRPGRQRLLGAPHHRGRGGVRRDRRGRRHRPARPRPALLAGR